MRCTDLEPEPGLLSARLNFAYGGSGNYDKNLTGRLYELVDEVRLVHEHLPRALMTGIFFLPVAAATDKTKGKSSFAHTVVKLRERTGRLDPSLAHHAQRCAGSSTCSRPLPPSWHHPWIRIRATLRGRIVGYSTIAGGLCVDKP
jgi:hypothetical protein